MARGNDNFDDEDIKPQNLSTRRRTRRHGSPASSEESCCAVLAKPKRLSKPNKDKKQLHKEIQYPRREALKHSPAAKQTLLHTNNVKKSNKKRLSDVSTPEEAQVAKEHAIAIIYRHDEKTCTTVKNNDGSVDTVNKTKHNIGCRKPKQSKKIEDKIPPRAPPELSESKHEGNFRENKVPTKKTARLTKILPKFGKKKSPSKTSICESLSAPLDPFASTSNLTFIGNFFFGNADVANNKSALDIAAEEVLRKKRASANIYKRQRATSISTAYHFQSFTDSTTKIDQLSRNDSSREIDHYSRTQSLGHGAEYRTLEPRIFKDSLNDPNPQFNIHFAPYYGTKKTDETSYYRVDIPSTETDLNLSPASSEKSIYIRQAEVQYPWLGSSPTRCLGSDSHPSNNQSTTYKLKDPPYYNYPTGSASFKPTGFTPYVPTTSNPHHTAHNILDYDELIPIETMNTLDEHERKIIIEFCHLLEKSKHLFNALRELPQYGHKQWQSYFGRTFDVYTKLWKFQQLHRTVLDNKYGLKRWQIGEIASKIGQLYYHFYLRTSETAYLNEAYSFYSAIRGRCYYTKASREDKCELMVKKLRYYARFIVVCLLLKKLKLVSELIRELDKQIVEYGNAYDPEDQAEWTVVVNEVKAFIKAEPVVSVIHPDNYSVTLSHRMNSATPVERLPQMILTLQEVLIVGSNSAQVKFSELTIDMFRMMQTLEREPTTDIQHMFDDSPPQQFMTAAQSKGYILESGLKYGENPHKYLLFKPSPSQIFVYLASGFNEMPLNGVLMLYISADGLMVPQSKHPEDAGGYEVGGLITTSKTDISYRETIKDGKPVPPKNKEPQVLHPGDLYAFTRRPLFLIIDSDNSVIFQNMPRHFGQPLVILMSPLEVPACLHVITADKRIEGSLFTLFLHCPLSAICHYCDIHEIPLPHWQRAQAYIEMFLSEASQIMTRSRPESMYAVFMGDDFLRLLILRFIMCETVMRMHRAFRSRNHLTRCSPPLSDDLFEHPVLTHIVMDLALHLQVRSQFHDPAVAGPPPNRE